MAKTVSERHDVLPALGEVFREHGFEGASLSLITERTGLGKGSLYHFFPGGKEEMASAVLADIDAWFEGHIFAPLRTDDDPKRAIRQMLAAVEKYFLSGRRVCLVGAFALSESRDRFAKSIRSYFVSWTDALTDALLRTGQDPKSAKDFAEEIVATIQGAIILARALNDPASFRRTLSRLESRL
ncbi:TetR/AcrR family transcriptional regulator [Pendulispora albinea]|uniref:TetR/AcrR family transcriptional regulator n=1 Tax=Pendulispora albinea TaxID=2741071 RepID=A0ABZ2LKE2_9BACT